MTPPSPFGGGKESVMADKIPLEKRVQGLEASLAELRRRMDLATIHQSQAIENVTRRIEALERRPVASGRGPNI